MKSFKDFRFKIIEHIEWSFASENMLLSTGTIAPNFAWNELLHDANNQVQTIKTIVQ